MMKISVIVAIYNASRYLRECLDSIVNQDFKGEYEVILVNDGSTDDSLSICQEYASKHTNITVLSGENGGVSVARNKGIHAAKGEWFVFVDADDIIFPNALTILYNRQRETNADSVRANHGTMSADGVILKSVETLPRAVVDNPIKHIPVGGLWGYLIPATIVKCNQIHFVEGLAYAEDMLFCVDVVLRCCSLATEENSVYARRIHSQSATHCANGVRMAKQQLWAASLVRSVSQSHREDLFNEYWPLMKITIKLIGGALGYLLRSEYSKSMYEEVRKEYFRLFKPSLFWSFVFYRRVYKNRISGL